MNVALYLITGAVLLYLSIYYVNSSLIFLFLCLALLPLAIAALAQISALMAKAAPFVENGLWDPGEKHPPRLFLQLEPRSPLPLPKLRYRVIITDHLGGERYSMKVNAYGKGQDMGFLLPWTPQGSGLYTITVDSAIGRDYLRLFPLYVPGGKNYTELTVLPTIYPCSLVISDNRSFISSDGEDYHRDKKGDDLTETFNVRPYAPGDKLSRTHWKLSLKLDKLMIKEGSSPSGYSLVVFADLRYLGRPLIDGLFSVSLALLELECPHYLSWFDGTKLQRCLIEEVQELYAQLQPLLRAKKLGEKISTELLYKEHYPADEPGLIIKLADGLYVDGKQILSSSDFPEKLSSQIIEL